MVTPLQSVARNDMEFNLTPELIAKIRVAHALWLPVEAGAPIVYVGKLPDRLDQLGEEPDAEAEEVLQGAEILLSHGSLLPATYTLSNFWKNYFPEGQCPIGPDTSACIAIPASEQLKFNLTDKHLKLLRQANVSGGGFNPKRPYGDMTYYYLDIAAVVGMKTHPSKDSEQEKFSKDQLKELDELHGEMLFTVQACLEHATIAPGTFVRKSRYDSWTRKP